MTARQSVVVLGGGEDQIPAYWQARALGYHVVGVDMNAHCLGASLADEFLVMTSRDASGIAAALGSRDVAAVISPASDAAQESVAALRAHFSTSHQVPETALRASVDKGAFHRVVAELGLPTYAYHQSSDRPALLEYARTHMTCPLVVKPSDSSGSKGLSYVESMSDLTPAVELAAAASPHGTVIIEEYVVGKHYSCETFFLDGELTLCAVTDRILTGPPHFISRTHILPAALAPAIRTRIEEAVRAIAAAIDLRSGPLNCDLIVTPDDRLVFVEMGARLGGNGMPLLVRWAYGVDTVAAAMDLALGRRADARPVHHRAATLHILGSDRSGVVRSIEGVAAVRALPEVVALEVFKEPGQAVEEYTQAGRKLGYLVLVADDREQLLATLDLAVRSMHFDIVNSDGSDR